MKKLLLILALISAGVSAPAYKGEITFKQSDGSTFAGHIKGDEWFSWVEDKQQNIIKYNTQSKNYEYAEVIDINGVLDLAPAGTEVTESNSSKVSALRPQIDKSVLSQIWKRKRSEALSHQVKNKQ